jgi:subtilisin family serine protease
MSIISNIKKSELTGKSTIIAVLDSGLDYFNPEFLDKNNETRIIEYYDQETGVIYSRKELNTAIKAGYPQGLSLVPVRDTSGHGTAVAAVAAGTTSGVATEADILAVKLAKTITGGFPNTAQLMQAVSYAINYAVSLNSPIAINISYGNTYGDHRGNSLLERFIDNASEIGKSAIIIGAGNEGTSNGHTAGVALKQTLIELSVSEYETEFSLQIWKYYQDDFGIKLTSPSGENYMIDSTQLLEAQALRIELEETTLLCYVGIPQPYNVEQEIFIDFVPKGDYITGGIWSITITPRNIVTGEYRMYLSGYSTRNTGTGFLKPTPDNTITIPSTARKAISVGAYDSFHNSYADFSGRGYVYRYEDYTQSLIASVKPDIVAPGVNILVPLPGGGSEKVSGTSFAAPFVTGLSSLLMEWGIIRKNDIYLYGERLKSALISNASPIGLNSRLPNSKIGWGKVDFLY